MDIVESAIRDIGVTTSETRPVGHVETRSGSRLVAKFDLGQYFGEVWPGAAVWHVEPHDFWLVAWNTENDLDVEVHQTEGDARQGYEWAVDYIRAA